jgi:hypothetical protein
MLRRRKILRAAAIVLGGLLFAIDVLDRPPATVISGHVYGGLDHSGPSAPVPDALVSNDWDATTSTTDVNGDFRLPLSHRLADDEFVVLTVRAGDVTVRQQMIGHSYTDLEIVLPVAPSNR